ncbi:hypothetical protein VW35_15245 [Devosia soli]|uniref:ORC1/DEAH AAA+ ATPase domain-containing protein n=1 Tax=Devosia soli TaxID=361041 RepID=A0A0F5L773_9HYPH|nr:TniB family NTP-binding protein [Devosia soli]KKB77492.1 hypothetical protein VW35_15245 [Devosia soli]
MTKDTELDKWATATIIERERHFGRAVIPNRITRKVADVLSFAHQSYSARHEGRLTLISGESRMGKTIACEQYIFDYAQEHGGRYVAWEPNLLNLRERDAVAGVVTVEKQGPLQTLYPVVMLQIGVNPTFQGIMRDAIFALTREAPKQRAGNMALAIQLSRLLGELGTGLLIFDEAQRIVDSMAGPGSRSAAEAFRQICKMTKIEVALVGTGDLMTVVDTAKDLRKMVEQSVTLAPFAFPEHEGSEWIAMLEELEAELPFDAQSDISSWKVATRLHRYSNGILGEVTTLLGIATKHAMANEEAYVDMDTLLLTLRERLSVPDDQNIFKRTDAALGLPKPKPLPVEASHAG